MEASRLQQRWSAGQAATTTWLTIPDAFAAEVVARAGADATVVDLQHGLIDYAQAVSLLQGLTATLATPLARVPGLEPALIMKLLDAGYHGIVCPLVNTADQAQRFVAACRYPPQGERSFGPLRAALIDDGDYVATANQHILCLAMVETQEGLNNLEAIAATPGLDAILIGPNDLSLALGVMPSSEPTSAVVVDAIKRIRTTAQANGRKAAIFCSGGAGARQRLEEGFDLVALGTDSGYLREAAQRAVAEAWGTD